MPDRIRRCPFPHSILPLPALKSRHCAAPFSNGSAAAELIDRVLARAAEWADPALWISRVDEAAVRRRASALDAAAKADPGVVARLPLFGIPFAVKDNIDVAGHTDDRGLPGLCLSPPRNRRRSSSG